MEHVGGGHAAGERAVDVGIGGVDHLFDRGHRRHRDARLVQAAIDRDVRVAVDDAGHDETAARIDDAGAAWRSRRDPRRRCGRRGSGSRRRDPPVTVRIVALRISVTRAPPRPRIGSRPLRSASRRRRRARRPPLSRRLRRGRASTGSTATEPFASPCSRPPALFELEDRRRPPRNRGAHRR